MLYCLDVKRLRSIDKASVKAAALRSAEAMSVSFMITLYGLVASIDSPCNMNLIR